LIDLECSHSSQSLSARNKLSEFVAGPDMTGLVTTVLPGGHSEWEPPDPFSNSEVKTLCADASVDFVDVKVGHCQALNSMKTKPSPVKAGGGFFVSPIAREPRRIPQTATRTATVRTTAEHPSNRGETGSYNRLLTSPLEESVLSYAEDHTHDVYLRRPNGPMPN
jgi:hypothetical protein